MEWDSSSIRREKQQYRTQTEQAHKVKIYNYKFNFSHIVIHWENFFSSPQIVIQQMVYFGFSPQGIIQSMGKLNERGIFERLSHI